jgi:hypothetical protein
MPVPRPRGYIITGGAYPLRLTGADVLKMPWLFRKVASRKRSKYLAGHGIRCHSRSNVRDIRGGYWRRAMQKSAF